MIRKPFKIIITLNMPAMDFDFSNLSRIEACGK